jgi:hypothetical protein
MNVAGPIPWDGCPDTRPDRMWQIDNSNAFAAQGYADMGSP